MPTYSVDAINLSSFPLGESDKVLTVFSAERGLLKVVAKGARKPGTKMAGRSEPLSVNQLLLAKGKTFDIVTQAQTIRSFPGLRSDLHRLTFSLYYAELTAAFALGLEQESRAYFEFLCRSVGLQSEKAADSAWLSLEFAMGLLEFLGYLPELTYCVNCRRVLSDHLLSRFNIDLGGVVCCECVRSARSTAGRRVFELEEEYMEEQSALSDGVVITPLVWKNLVLAGKRQVFETGAELPRGSVRTEARQAAQKILKSYAEHRAGRRLRALDLLDGIQSAP